MKSGKQRRQKLKIQQQTRQIHLAGIAKKCQRDL